MKYLLYFTFILISSQITVITGYGVVEYLSYKNIEGWGHVYSICAVGKEQSPIDLGHYYQNITFNKESSPLKFENYDAIIPSVVIENNGIDVTLSTSSYAANQPFITASFLNGRYIFSSLHLHWGATDKTGTEHTIDNKRYAVEAQLYHINEKYQNLQQALQYTDGVVIIALLYKVDPNNQRPNKAMEAIASVGNSISTPGYRIEYRNFDFSGFRIEKNIHAYYYYRGSLTVPPCTEGIQWIVARNTFPISPQTMTWLRSMQHTSKEEANIRPQYNLGERTIYYYNPMY